MPNKLLIAPNRPVYVALVDPAGEWDDENREGRYQTTAGQLLTLPRPAVVKLNLLEPKPGEEILILKRWSGKSHDRPEWVISLSNRSEKASAEAEKAQDQPREPGKSVTDLEERIKPVEAPTPIRRQSKREDTQPGLFDTRGTGTYGPVAMPGGRAYAAPHVASRKPPAAAPIPWNVAFREVSSWVHRELQNNHLQWSDQTQQAMVCTVLISESHKGRIGPWEREK